MARLTFSEEESLALKKERFSHPHPRVQQRMDVLWFISLGETIRSIQQLKLVAESKRLRE